MLTDYTWRAATYADLPAIHALFVAIGLADGDATFPSLADLQREFEDEWSPAPTETQLALAPDGTVAAYARLYTNPAPTDALRTHIDDDVHPAHRDGGLPEALLTWAETRARARQAEIAAPTGFSGPRAVRGRTNAALAARIGAYTRLGFTPVRHFFRMRRDLSQPIPDLALPAGLTLTPYQLAFDEALRQADNEAFTDHWQHEEISVVDWHKFIIGHTAFRPDLTWVVHDGAQIAAFSLNRVDPDENARLGYTTGWVGSLGTRRPWRKRGLAAFLLAQSFRAFKAQGLDFATLGVDAENPSGALGLYERLGFVTFRTTIAFGKDLP